MLVISEGDIGGEISPEEHAHYNPLLVSLMRRISSTASHPFLGAFCFFVTFFLVGVCMAIPRSSSGTLEWRSMNSGSSG
jgi:hypothetical protein